MKMKKLLSLLTATAISATLAGGVLTTGVCAKVVTTKTDFTYKYDFSKKYSSSNVPAVGDTVDLYNATDESNANVMTVEFLGGKHWTYSSSGIAPQHNNAVPTGETEKCQDRVTTGKDSNEKVIYSTGCALKIKANEDGKVLIDYKLQAGKTLAIDKCSDGDQTQVWSNSPSSTVYNTADDVSTYSYDIEANTDYIIYAYGGTGNPFYAIYFEPGAGESVTASYSIDGMNDVLGIVPANTIVEVGGSITLPSKNYTLYKDGYTLTGWSDGSSIYNPGSNVTLNESTTFNPVFTPNSITTPGEVVFDFNYQQNGNQGVAFQGNSGIFVTQDTNGNDVKMDIDATNGKFNNNQKGGETTAQANAGTKLTVPVVKGSVISMVVSNNNSYSIAGQSVSGSGTEVTINDNITEAEIIFTENNYVTSITITPPETAPTVSAEQANDGVDFVGDDDETDVASLWKLTVKPAVDVQSVSVKVNDLSPSETDIKTPAITAGTTVEYGIVVNLAGSAVTSIQAVLDGTEYDAYAIN